VEPPPTEKQQKKQSKARLAQQRAEQAFSELDAKNNKMQPPQPKTPKPDVQDKTALKESEKPSITSPAKSDFSTPLPLPLTEEQRAEGWVDAIGKCYQCANMTAEEAQRRALKDAELNAIEQAFGVSISAQTLQLRSETQQDFHESFIEMSQLTVYGRIIGNEKPIWLPVESIQFSHGEPPIPLYRVFLRAKVAEEKGKPDPNFNVTLKLNDGKVTFR